MWRKLAILCCALPLSACFVSIDQGLSDVYLAPLETAYFDVSTAFSGQFLEYRVGVTPPHEASIEFDLSLEEMHAAATLQRKVHFGQVFSGFLPIFSQRNIEVWDTTSTPPTLAQEVVASHDIEGLMGISENHTWQLLYWTIHNESREFYIVNPLLSDTATRLENIDSYSGNTVIACDGYLALIVTSPSGLAASQTLKKFRISASTAESIETASVSFPSEIVSAYCQHNPAILTASGLFENSGVYTPLERAIAADGQFLRLIYHSDAQNSAVQTETGLLYIFMRQLTILVPNGTHAFEDTNSDNQFQAILSDKGNWFLSFFRCDSTFTSFLIPLPLREKFADVLETKAIKQNGALNNWLLALATEQGTVWYSLRQPQHPLLRIVGRAEPFTFELCAFNHFNSSDCRCITVQVKVSTTETLFNGGPIGPSTTFDLTCQVTASPQLCEYQLSAYFSDPMVQFQLEPPDAESGLNITVQNRFSYFTFSFDIPDRGLHLGCTDKLLAEEVKVVFLGVDRVVIANLKTGQRDEINLAEGIEFLRCEIVGNAIMLYGVSQELLGTLYRICNGHLSKLDVPEFKSTPLLKKNRFSLLAAIENYVFISKEAPEPTEELTIVSVNSTIRDIFVDDSDLSILIEGTIFIYNVQDVNCSLSQAFAISPKEQFFSRNLEYIFTYDTSNTLSKYFLHANTTAERLYTMKDECQFSSLQAQEYFLLRVCNGNVQVTNTESAGHQWVSLGHFPPEYKLAIIYSVQSAILAIGCNGCECTAQEWRETASPALFLNFSSSSGELQEHSKSIVVQLSVSSFRTSSVPIAVNITFLNSGAVPLALPDWHNKTLFVPGDQELEVPVSTFFSGNDLTVLANSTDPIEDISVIPPFSVIYSLDLRAVCLSQFIVVAELKLLVCYKGEKIQMYQYNCENDNCTYTAKAKYEVQDGLLIYSLQYIAKIQSKVIFYFILYHLSRLYDIQEHFLLFFDNSGNTVDTWKFSYVGKGDNKIYAIPEAETKCHLFLYGLFFQHFIVFSSIQMKVEETAAVTDSYNLRNILSVSGYTKDRQVLLNVLDRDSQLYTFTIEENLRLLGYYRLDALRQPFFITTILQENLLYQFSSHEIRVFMLPEMHLTTVIHLPGSGRKEYVEVTFIEQNIVAISMKFNDVLIVNASAPQQSNILCVFHYKELTSNGGFVIGRNFKTIDIIEINTPSLRVRSMKNQYQKLVRKIDITACNPYNQSTTISILIHRDGDSNWAVYLFAAAICVGLVWIGQKWRGYRRLERQQRYETEMAALHRQST